MEEEQYVKGFNNGYLLAKHEPELAAQLAGQSNAHNLYFQGLVNGKEQYEKEVREWSKSFSKAGPAKDQREPGRER